MIDEEIDPSDQVTCSVFVKWLSEGEPGEQQQPQPYTMTMSPLFANKEDQQAEQQDVRVSILIVFQVITMERYSSTAK